MLFVVVQSTIPRRDPEDRSFCPVCSKRAEGRQTRTSSFKDHENTGRFKKTC